MDAPSEPPPAQSSVLRSATLASVTLLLDAKNLCELVGCSEDPGLEQTATGDHPGKGSRLLQNSCLGDSFGGFARVGRSGAEQSDNDSVIKPEERKEGLGAGPGERSSECGQSKGANEARGEEYDDSWRRRTASCQGGAALALRLVERLLVEAVSSDWRAPPAGASELDNVDGGGMRTVSGPFLDGGRIRTGDPLHTLRRSKGPVLGREQLLELVCVHCVLVSFLRRAHFESGEKAEAEKGGKVASHSGSSSDIGFGLPTLLDVLDYIEPSCRAPSVLRPVQLNPSAQLAVLHISSLARRFLDVPSGSAGASKLPGVTLRDVGGLAQKAVGLFKGSSLSALELAGFQAPRNESEAEPAEEGGLLQSMPAALALARALRVTSADLAAVVAGKVDNGTAGATLEDSEGVLKMGKAPAREEGVKGVALGRSGVQLAALTALSDAFQWLASHSVSFKTQVESNESRGPDGATEENSEILSESLAPNKQGAQSAAEVDGLVASCLSPDESAAASLVARELVEENAAVGESGLEGAPNPLGQLLVYVAVILRLEMEAGLETPLLAAFCQLLTSLVRFYSASHPPDGALRLATGVARGLVASFDIPAGAPLESLVTLVLEHSPLEVAVSWAASAVSDCLGTATRLVEDCKDIGLESLEKEERGCSVTEAAGLAKGAGEGGLEGVTDGRVPVRGGMKRGDVPPQKSPDCEEAMLSWVENGGLKTEVPELEKEAGGVIGGSGSASLVVQLATNECRIQTLNLALEFLVRTVERGAGSNRNGGGETGEGHVAEDEGGHVELGLEPLTQILGALTAVCDADVAVELQETGAVGLLDERQGLQVLRGVCAALSPVEEGVLWLSDLCESALSEVGRAEDADGFKGTGLGASEVHGSDKPASGGCNVSGSDPPGARSPADLGMEVRISEGSLKGIPSDGTRTAGNASISGSERGNPVEEFAGEEPAAMVGAKTAHEDGAGAETPEASQLEAAAELVQLGAAMHCAAERLMERKRGHWSVVAEDKVLQTALVRFRKQLESLLAAYEACRATRAPTGLLDCLAPLCEDLKQAGFRASDNGRLLTTDGRTDFPVTDAYESGREEAADLTGAGGLGAGGLEGGGEEERTPTGKGASDVREKSSDAARKGFDAASKDAEEVGSDVREGGSEAGDVDSDSKGAKTPADSVPRTRSGRKSAAPSAWWAVVDQEKGKEERGAKRKASESVRKRETASESVRKRESASEKRSKVAPEMEVALVEQGGEMAEIDLEEEERRNDRRSKRRRKMLAVKKRKAAARGPSGNKFVAYALEEQMLDSESEWDSDEYSDMEDFIALENEEVDFKTMPLSTITPYVPYEEPEEEAAAPAEAEGGVA